MTDDDLMDILNTARSFNPTKDITGMLLYRQGYFIQALEGEEEDVLALYNKISQDKRHSNVLLISKEPIQSRSFSKWSMGFQNLDRLDPEFYKAHQDVLNAHFDDETLTKAPSRARKMLQLFAEEANY